MKFIAVKKTWTSYIITCPSFLHSSWWRSVWNCGCVLFKRVSVNVHHRVTRERHDHDRVDEVVLLRFADCGHKVSGVNTDRTSCRWTNADVSAELSFPGPVERAVRLQWSRHSEQSDLHRRTLATPWLGTSASLSLSLSLCPSIRPCVCVLFVRLICALVMAALHSRCGHYIFALWFLSIFFYLFLFLA